MPCGQTRGALSGQRGHTRLPYRLARIIRFRSIVMYPGEPWDMSSVNGERDSKDACDPLLPWGTKTASVDSEVDPTGAAVAREPQVPVVLWWQRGHRGRW